ncbi:MAG: 1-deoxy-D-xylulose-5-phosphate synthase, partial [Clostridia bacterium]|nr:1-deoxy-D-xylulose-5-phosphate synthase [Clostridia bacterium]
MGKFLSISEVKALSCDQARLYAEHLRSVLVDTVLENGGHLASNLGIVEISLALVRVMDLEKDKIIYDTGHQSYVHKILTGRGDKFSTLRRFGGLSGFPKREESPFDPFSTGHSGTALSAATAFAKEARLSGEEAFSVCVIGDGSFTGGMVYEAINNISPEDRVIIVLNDNKMSIGRSVGRVRSTLNKLRTPGYYRFKSEVEDALENIPYIGREVAKVASRMKNIIKRQALPGGTFFEEMGLHYFGPADGNNLEKVQNLLVEAKKRQGPSVIHLCTQKGKGYAPAQKDPSRFHGISPKGEKRASGDSFSKIFGEEIVSLAEKDEKIIAITAAMTDGVGLSEFEKRFPERFFDTGITEEHAMTFAAGLSAAGKK